MQLLTSILLDFGNNSYTPTVYAKRRDSKSRFIAITPCNNGEDLELTDGITARIHLTKPDGHTVFDDCIISNNEIRVALTAQILSVEGLAVAEIGLYEGEALLSSQNFFINIDASAFDENAPESSDEFNALVKTLADAEKAIESANEAANKAFEAIKEICDKCLTDEQISNIEKNTQARHTHSNQENVLDNFGLNYAGNRPTFMGSNNILLTNSDVIDRLKPYALANTVPNAAAVDGSKLKMQIDDGLTQKTLFSVDLPASGSERPTAVFEFEGSSECFLSPDMPSTYMLTVADNYMDSDIPLGAELKTIEFQFKNNGEWDEEWVDIHFIELVDGAAYALHMDKVIDYEGYKMFATIAFFNRTGFIYGIAHSWQDARIRITYYTDNIGGENNA